MIDNGMAALLGDGFSARMAREYQDALIREDTNPMYDPAYRSWAHAHGFLAESACAYELTEKNKDDYLSDRDYYRVWPLNGWQRVWINDKLTLKYMLSGTEYDKYLPQYYFYSTAQGLMPLIDSGAKGTMDHFLGVLREHGAFACKPANGECSQGFNKLSYENGSYLIDNREASEDDVRSFVIENPNNVFTEFFRSGCGMEDISPVVHTLRVLTVNPTGSDPVLAASYLRFATGTGTDDSIANYCPPEKEGVCSFNVGFDLDTGEFGDGRLVYGNRVIGAPRLPDTDALAEGTMPYWSELRTMIEGLAERLSLVEYMGFDVCVAQSGPKLIEINSHSGSKYLQLFRPFLADGYLGAYFRDKLAAIDALDEAGLRSRNEAVR